jgi:TolB protein
MANEWKIETEPLFPGNVEVVVPAFSPDGTKVAFVRLTDPDTIHETRDLGCLTILDRETRTVLHDVGKNLVAVNYRERGRGANELVFAWSPDSRYLTFHQDRQQWEHHGSRWSLFRFDTRTGSVDPFPFDPEGFRAQAILPSPSGQYLAIHSRQRWKPYTRKILWKTSQHVVFGDQLVVCGPLGEDPVNVIDWPRERHKQEESLGDFHWSPDKDALAYIVRYKDGRFREECLLLHYDVRTRTTRELFRTSEHLDHFSFSGDGRTLWFHTRDRRIENPQRRNSVYRLDLESGESTLLLEHREFFYPLAPRTLHGHPPILLEMQLESGGRGIALYHPEDHSTVPVVKAGYSLYPLWSPAGDSFLYLRTKPDSKPFWTWPTEPVLQKTGGGSPNKLLPVDASAKLVNCRPAFSRTGREIVFVAKDEADDSNERFAGLWLSRVDPASGEGT